LAWPVGVAEPPTHLHVQNVGGGAVRVAWSPAPTDTIGLTGDAATGYRLYTSPDGFAWGAPVAVSGTNYPLTGLTPGAEVYAYVTSVNAGGESLPTEVLGARVGDPTLLIVNGFDKLAYTQLPWDDDPLVGSSRRLWLTHINRRAYVVHHGQAAPALYAWDSASNEAVSAGWLRWAIIPWWIGFWAKRPTRWMVRSTRRSVRRWRRLWRKMARCSSAVRNWRGLGRSGTRS
jgi:hypothetical protein